MERSGCFFSPAARFFIFLGITKLIFRIFSEKYSFYIWLVFIFVVGIFGLWWRFGNEKNNKNKFE